MAELLELPDRVEQNRLGARHEHAPEDNIFETARTGCEATLGV
jgi:hypothetical protein